MSDNYFKKNYFLEVIRLKKNIFLKILKILGGQTLSPRTYYCTKLLIKSNVVILQANKQNIHQAVRSQEFDDQIQPHTN